MSLRNLMNKTFPVYRKQRVYDGQGGYKEEFAFSHNIEGRIRPALYNEVTIAAQRGAEITHVVYCINDQDIQRGDELRFDGRVVEIMTIREPSKPGHFECDAREVQRG